MKYTFPDDFLFGASVWATGTEGAAYSDGKSETVWDRGYRLDPGRFYERVSPDDTLDMYHDYHQEVEAVRKMGLTSYRTSVLWSRLIPDGKNINQKAAEYYRNMLRAFKGQGVFLSVVLY
ncbi:MAG: glycoside hydrolase family 1 protein, partial [Erysipelotrichaceae bacterium]|nr:glycoside hydrolase family 1 protein [Erysipelotrichaceae bacterium]